MKNIKIIKENEIQYAIYINDELYTRVGCLYNAKQIKKNLDFIYNI